MPVIEMIKTICDIVALENNQPIHQQLYALLQKSLVILQPLD